MRRELALALLAATACHGACQDSRGSTPPSGEEFAVFPPGATAEEVVKAVDGRPGKKEGIHTPGHGSVYFVIFRDGERHGTAYRQEGFHAVIGGGVRLPEGTLVVRREWATSGQIDGMNEEPERYGVSVAVEPGAKKPYSDAVREAAATLVEAIASRAPLHPDCVLAMEEIAYTKRHASDAYERDLAKAARARVPVPQPNAKVVIRSGEKEILVDAERRDTSDAIAVGMMFRRGFDGEDRGMLFEYPHADYRRFWMRNCRMPIDVAYINRKRIEQIHTMSPGFGLDQRHLRYYESNAVANLALEMPAGWFEEHGVKPGDTVTVR